MIRLKQVRAGEFLVDNGFLVSVLLVRTLYGLVGVLRLIVFTGFVFSSFSTFVELFHLGGLNLTVSSPGPFRRNVGDSGVIMLWECLCAGL